MVLWELQSSILVFLIACNVISTVSSCQDGQLRPDSSNCGNYLQCDHGKDIVRQCPQGLHFNPSSSNCDWPANANCKEGGSSGATSSTTTSTTPASATPEWGPTSSPPQSTTTPTAGGGGPINPGARSPRFAPYFDVNMKGPSLKEIYSKTGQKDFTLAFALGSSESCKPKWGGTLEINDTAIIGPVKQLQAAGGQFIVATGGAMGPYIEHQCSSVNELANAYKVVMDAVGTNHVDVDIESTVDADRVNGALAKVQRDRPGTTISYTLMVQAEDYGLTPALGVDILKNAKKNGVQVTIVNPMCMEFSGPSSDFGDSVVGAAQSVLKQMKEIWPEKSDQELKKMLGVTPMLGKNYNGKVFTQEHARKLVNWANQNRIGLLAFWSVGRDNGGCAGGGISPTCSSIAQSEYEFTKIFQRFTG